MGSSQEIHRIQAWMASFSSGSGGEPQFSMEDIRNICRGPMRQVLLDFLVPRFQTDEQIKVMRSNLFLNDVTQKDPHGEGYPQARFDKEINELKGKLNGFHDEKIKTVQKISSHVEKFNESKQSTQTGLVNLVSLYEKCESRAQLIRDRVASISILVQDLRNAKATSATSGNLVGLKTTSETEVTPGSEHSPSTGDHLPQLRLLYNNALDLFDLYFLPNSFSPNNTVQSNLSPEVQALTTAVAMQTADLAHSGIGPAALEKWEKNEQENSSHKIKTMCMKFSNVMNPLEELQNETNSIYVKLMNVQIGLHLNNLKLKKELKDLIVKNKTRIHEVILGDPNIIPADFLSLIRTEGQSEQLSKCRQLAKQLRQIENICQNNEDEDMLALLCEDSGSFSDEMQIGQGASSMSRRLSLRASLGSADGNGSFAKQETLEDLTCALLKSFPHSRKQLEVAIQQCKNLVLERLPKILSKDNASADKSLMSVPPTIGLCGGMSSDGIKITIPKQFIPNHHLLNSSSLPCEKMKDDLLSEVFRKQKELETRRAQSEAILRERGSIVPSEV